MNKGKIYQPIKCANCGQIFTPNRKWQKFCSSYCRVQFWYKEKTKSDRLKSIEERIERIEKQLGIK